MGAHGPAWQIKYFRDQHRYILHLASAELIWGVTDNHFLVNWESASPTEILYGTAITGLQANETILGIDVRAADGGFYAVGSSNRLYSLSTSGAATQVGSTFSTPLNGSSFGFDFDPTIDVGRIDTNTNNNYALDPITGSIAQGGALFYENGDANFGVAPNIVHTAYTNNFDGAMTTQLYGIDPGLNILVEIDFLTGALTTIGGIGFSNDPGGFDISGQTGIAYAALQDAGAPRSDFYTINLSTGQTTQLGTIGGGITITAIMVQPAKIPEPMSIGLLSLCSIVVLLRRRR